jgi:hypothetical protein
LPRRPGTAQLSDTAELEAFVGFYYGAAADLVRLYMATLRGATALSDKLCTSWAEPGCLNIGCSGSASHGRCRQLDAPYHLSFVCSYTNKINDSAARGQAAWTRPTSRPSSCAPPPTSSTRLRRPARAARGTPGGCGLAVGGAVVWTPLIIISIHKRFSINEERVHDSSARGPRCGS